MNGFIKLHRQLEDWEWYTNIPVKTLFIHCLIKANHKDNKWQGIVIKKGSFVTSYENLAFETGLTVQQVRTALNKLKITGEVTRKSTSQYSIITVNNWNEFQENDKQVNNQITNEQQTNNNQITTNKNEKNEKNDKKFSFNNTRVICNEEKKEKKLDPFINPIKTFFIEEYKKVFGRTPMLSSFECNRLVELASENKDIKEIIPLALRRLKTLEFDGINFTPTANWLLKENNFERIINGEFEYKKDNNDAVFERLRQKWEKGGV